MFILARRALDRRNKRMVSLVAGNDPVKPPGEEALRRRYASRICSGSLIDPTL